jgi:hypothetical protein
MKRHTNSPASVLAQLKNIAKANNVVFAEILNRYAIERIWNAFIRKSRLTGLTPDLFTVVATIRDFYSKIIGCVK